MSAKNVFIVGPGFIGWNIIDLLVPEGYNVSGLVRRKEHADGITASGAKAVLGDINDKEVISDNVQAADIVIHTASADHLPSVQGVIDGLRKRAAAGKQTIYLHTSGTSLLDDNSNGAFKSDKIYNDENQSEIDGLPDSAPHRDVDLEIVKAKKELGDKAKISIVIPPLIYGYNPKHERVTIQIPTLTRFARKHGYAGYVGKGLAVESNIHVLDLARAFVVLLHAVEKASPSDELIQNPYFYVENSGDNEPSWKEVAEAIGEGLHKAGVIKDATPKTIPEDLHGDLFAQYTGAVVGLNSRSRANRLRKLGWKPQEKSWRESYLEDELPVLLKEDVSNFAGYLGAVPNQS